MPVASCGDTYTRDLFSKPTNPSNFNFKSTKKKTTQPQQITLYPQFNTDSPLKKLRTFFFNIGKDHLFQPTTIFLGGRTVKLRGG